MGRVLLVDDEPLVRLALKSLIPWGEHGFADPLEAGNGEQALRLLAKHPDIELVFLDISMPVMNGLELLERLRLADRMPEVIVLSAYGDYPLVREAFKLGVADYLIKADLDAGRVLPLLAAVKARLASRRQADVSPAELVRREAGYLKEELLLRLLRPEGVERFEDHREILGIRLGGQVRIAILWIEDFPTVARRYEEGALRLLAATVLNAAAQVLARRPGGEAVRRADDEYVLFLPPDETMGILEEVRSLLAHSANLSVSFGVSSAAPLAPSLSSLFEEARRNRTLLSRLALRARDYIHRNYNRADLGLPELSRYLGVSRSHFCYQFARETGSPFKEYLTRVRVEEAKRLLADTRLKVYEVSERVGYSSVEHFSRVFKRLVGIPPHLYARSPDENR
jgi:YesN/AraC family two-component response regulator